jgi:GTP-binding protein HflX
MRPSEFLALVGLGSAGAFGVPLLRSPRALSQLGLSSPARTHPLAARIRMMSTIGFGSESIELNPGAKAMVVGVQVKQAKYKTLQATWTLEDSLDELVRLCETAGLNVVARESQVMQHPSPSTFIGTGKLDELVESAIAQGVTVLVFDDELTPAQARNLQAAFVFGSTTEALVIDRTQLILQIFAQRARTRVAKLQVQAAQMKYMLPRLTSFLTAGAGMDAKGGSGGGSGGGGAALRGSGETQLEVDKRLFRKQIGKIEADMEEVRAQRERYRAKRSERDRLPVLAIVGYTNAGKSTLLNTLCGGAEDQVYADDLLFATLDPTSRVVRLREGRELMVSDTVGFIQKLPTRLVASFRATLDELEDASVILHVVDAASEHARQQVWSVQQIILELGQQETPQILVLNKADKAGAAGADLEQALSVSLDGSGGDAATSARQLAGAELGRLPEGSPLLEQWLSIHEGVRPQCAVLVSAKTGAGLDELLETVEDTLRVLAIPVEALVPYSAGDVLAEIHRDGTIALEEYQEGGTYVRAHVPRSLFNRLRQSKYVVAPSGKSRTR